MRSRQGEGGIATAVRLPPVKFTCRRAPGSPDLANLRASLRIGGCPHCQRMDTLVGHGFLKGLAPKGSKEETRGPRMWCSDRGFAIGCGRTFSVHWDDCIARATLRISQLLALLREMATAPTRHAAWHRSGITISLTGAYRWFARWQRGAARLITWLCPLADPPEKSDGQPDPLNLRHLHAAFPGTSCPAAAFQIHFQIPLLP